MYSNQKMPIYQLNILSTWLTSSSKKIFFIIKSSLLNNKLPLAVKKTN